VTAKVARRRARAGRDLRRSGRPPGRISEAAAARALAPTHAAVGGRESVRDAAADGAGLNGLAVRVVRTNIRICRMMRVREATHRDTRW